MSRRPPSPQISETETKRFAYHTAPISEIELGVAKALHAANKRRVEARALAARSAAATEPPPLGNTGGKYQNERLVWVDGEAKIVPARRGWGGDSAFVDWINFTVHDSTFSWKDGDISDDKLILEASAQLQNIFGFGITRQRDRGANFYQKSYEITDSDGLLFGLVCIGGQRNTLLFSISGEGLAAALGGWESRLFDFLENDAKQPRITRIDVAYDDFEGEKLSAESMESAYDAGLFNNGGRNPDIELRGNWKNPNGKGRTIYVGSRANGKFFRGYEKGCQLGDPASKWFRAECEFKAVDRHIPHDILLRAGEYLAASYPALGWISERQERILTVQKTVQVSYDRTVNWLKHQCGAALNLMLQVEQDASKVLDLVIREGKIPRGVKVPDFRSCSEFIHEHAKEPALPFFNFATAPYDLQTPF